MIRDVKGALGGEFRTEEDPKHSQLGSQPPSVSQNTFTSNG